MNLEGPQHQPFISTTAVVPESDDPHVVNSRLSPYLEWTPLKGLRVEEVRDSLRHDHTREIHESHVIDLLGSAYRSVAIRRGGEGICMKAEFRKVSILARLFCDVEGRHFHFVPDITLGRYISAGYITVFGGDEHSPMHFGRGTCGGMKSYIEAWCSPSSFE